MLWLEKVRDVAVVNGISNQLKLRMLPKVFIGGNGSCYFPIGLIEFKGINES
jgi:hypothetical protein